MALPLLGLLGGAGGAAGGASLLGIPGLGGSVSPMQMFNAGGATPGSVSPQMSGGGGGGMQNPIAQDLAQGAQLANPQMPQPLAPMQLNAQAPLTQIPQVNLMSLLQMLGGGR